ncbi:MAG: GIY-YIG nuclease family protein [Gammaproteobacteria bacterium]|nr:GIY-YIG nuclease family protein [Gammaproteobacteria bacterium]
MQSYQLHIRIVSDITVNVGSLGKMNFPAGIYTYTGSARKNIYSRVKRHLTDSKKPRWHIDYLLAAKEAEVIGVRYSAQPECSLNQASDGEIVLRRFGASDCVNGCHSHLKLRRPL